MSLLKNKKFICFTVFLAILIAIECNYAFAQGINIDFGGEDEQTLFSNKVIQLIGLITILSVAPSILIMVTSFTKITIVFS
jgi:flagellar biosynthetic protein FliP